ncbi:hypothetical protein HK097_000148 [Rhizophlyctis rosea]|uniref:WD40 repeat-like protein n=1 Tax=Rhizophlyctis rosea TaxID=64517 RepID=A0AAD5X1N5_9FUNG|nr:hypothetical protein HK097_000148 [Rhizophlyctis rosea]
MTSQDERILTVLIFAMKGVAYPHIIVPYTFADQGKSDRPFAIAKPRAQPVEGAWGQLRRLYKAYSSWKETGIFPPDVDSLLDATYALFNTHVIRRVSRLLNQEEHYYERLLKRLNEAPIKAFGWHNYRQLFAVAHRQDSVLIYDMVAEHWFPESPKGLINEYQKNVTCLAWRPNASGVLAVGCQTGVILWRIFYAASNSPAIYPRTGMDVTSLVDPAQPGSHWATKLSFPGFGDVTTLSWSPDGLFLAVGSGTSSTILIWDVAAEAATPVAMGWCGTRELKWSPDGNYLLQADVGHTLRIWETRTWENTALNCAAAAHSLNWLRGSKMFVFAQEGQSRMHIRQMNREPPHLENMDVKVPTAKMSTYDFVPAGGSDGDMMTLAGPIKNIAVDPSGSRIVVSFEGDHRGSELVAVLEVERTALPYFRPLGYIRGPKWHPQTPRPQAPRSPFKEETLLTEEEEIERVMPGAPWPKAGEMVFSPTFGKGALLSVCWENGKIGFVPFLFKK